MQTNATTQQTNAINNALFDGYISEVTKRSSKVFSKTEKKQLLKAQKALKANNYSTALPIFRQIVESTNNSELAKYTALQSLNISDPFITLEHCLTALELAPEDSKAIEYAARALARSGEIEGAWALLENNPQLSPALHLTTVEAIRAAKLLNDTYQLHWLYKKLNTLYGHQTADIHVILSQALLEDALNKEIANAGHAQRAYQTAPNLALAVRLFANRLYLDDNAKEASLLLQRWILNKQNAIEERINLSAFLSKIDKTNALAHIEKMLLEQPKSGTLLINAADIHMGNSSFFSAISLYEKLLQIPKLKYAAQFNLGHIYMSTGFYNKAVIYFSKIKNTDVPPEHQHLLLETRLRLASIEYLTTGNGSGAFDELQRDYPTNFLSIIEQEIKLLDVFKHKDRLLNLLNQGLAIQPQNINFLYQRSYLYDSHGNYTEAIEDLRTALTADPNNPDTLNSLGYTLANRGTEFDEAQDLITRALSMKPEDPAFLDSMGWVLYKQGLGAEAVLYLKAALKQLVDEDIIVHLAIVLHSLDRLTESKTVLDLGLKNIPTSKMIKNSYLKLGITP